MKLQRVLLPLLVLGGLVIFTLENWSPRVPLVIFSTQTIALPLSLWILVACLAGALTTVAIALCLRFLIHESHPPTKEDVQSFGAPMPQAPRQTTHRSNGESTPDDSTSQTFTSRFNPLRFTRQSSDLGMEDWEDFSRPREEWEDWQQSNPGVAEVDFDQPMSSGSRFGRSSGHTSRSPQASSSERSTPQQDTEFYERDRPRAYERPGYDAQGYEDDRYEQREEAPRGDRRDRDRYGYRDDDDSQNDDGAYDDRPDRYHQDPQTGYGPPRDIRDDYSKADYGGDRYDQDRYDHQDRYDQDTYAPEGYAQAPYGDDHPYGRTGRDGDHSPPNPAPPYNQYSEQYIMDYGDEAALDAFDAELEARSKSRAKIDPGNDVSAQTGRYRWKNPFKTQPQTPQSSTSDDDLDLSSLDDWDE